MSDNVRNEISLGVFGATRDQIVYYCNKVSAGVGLPAKFRPAPNGQYEVYLDYENRKIPDDKRRINSENITLYFDKCIRIVVKSTDPDEAINIAIESPGPDGKTRKIPLTKEDFKFFKPGIDNNFVWNARENQWKPGLNIPKHFLLPGS